MVVFYYVVLELEFRLLQINIKEFALHFAMMDTLQQCVEKYGDEL